MLNHNRLSWPFFRSLKPASLNRGLLLSALSFCLITSVSSSALLASAQPSGEGEYSQASREYHLKAAFLRYVAKFVEWPSSGLPEGALNICVLGQVPYFAGLNSINGKIVNDRALTISKILDISAAKDHCQMVFVAKTEEEQIQQIITAIKGQPILTFGDMEHFAEQGGNMNFYIANNRLAIMTNLSSIDSAALKINPEMLRLVTVVPPTDSQPSK